MGDEETQNFRVRGGRDGNQEAVRPIGEVANKDLVEATGFGGLGEVADVAAIQDHRRRCDDLRCLAVVDHADEFDGHGCFLVSICWRQARTLHVGWKRCESDGRLASMCSGRAWHGHPRVSLRPQQSFVSSYRETALDRFPFAWAY